MIHVHLLNSSEFLEEALVGDVEDLAAKTARRVAPDLGISDVDLVLCDYPGLAIPSIGVGGYAPGAHLAFIALDPQDAGFSEWRSHLPATIAHELHHLARWSGPGYGTTLLDSLVSEGLATLHETEYMGREPVYARAVRDLDALWHEVEPLLDRTDLHAQYFFGAPGVPQWAGYSLGYELARRYCANRGIAARDAAMVPASDFRDVWEEKE